MSWHGLVIQWLLQISFTYKGTVRGWLSGQSTKHPAVSSLYAKIHQFLFSSDGSRIPSMEEKLFQIVMKHFYLFEHEVS